MNNRPLMVDFLMPESDKDRGENPIVDSLAVASDWTIVSKCALHGLIYVYDLKVNIIAVPQILLINSNMKKR